MNDRGIKKKTICFHIRDISDWGGTGRVVSTLANLLVETGKYNVIILNSKSQNGKRPRYELDKNIEVLHIFDKLTLGRHLVLGSHKIRRIIKQKNIDIILSVDLVLSLVDIPACIGTKCKNIAWEHFNFHYEFGQKRMAAARKLAAKYADAIVVLTDADKRNYQENLNVKNKICRIYNPLSSINESQTSKYKAAKRGNLLVSCGRLTDQKGFDILLDVANELVANKVDFTWRIVGDGEDRKKLEEKIHKLQLERYVAIVGSINNVEAEYERARIFVLTSRYEGLGMVLLEAQQCRLPVVSFDCEAGPSEIIIDKVNGFLIPNFDIKLMSRKIQKLLSDDRMCDFFSKHSHDNLNNFSKESVLESWEGLFKELLGNE